jgi:RNA polymerase sigma-70 factor (ECF subfamily)
MGISSELVEKLKAKNPAAQRELFHKYNARVFLYFKLRIKGEEDYEDLVQEVFASFFDGVYKDKVKEDRFIGPYIFGIAKRVVYNFFYKKKRSENIRSRISNELEISYQFDEEHKLENENITQLIQKIIEKLPAIDKTILKEFYLKENSVGEVAETVGKSKHYVSVRKLRAINRIKNEILKRKNVYI